MREHPWNVRRPSTEHYLWFQRLTELHEMTQSWLKDLGTDESSDPYQLKRVLSPGAQRHLWQIEKMAKSSVPSSIEHLLDESAPEELLTQLEHTLWVVQAWMLRGILERTPEAESPALRNILEQSSWKSGRKCGQSRWKSFPQAAENDLRALVSTFHGTPLSGYPHAQGFLMIRYLYQEVNFELLQCPHRLPYAELGPLAGSLCELHAHWLRGFAYAVQSRAVLEYLPASETQARCQVRCRFHLEQ